MLSFGLKKKLYSILLPPKVYLVRVYTQKKANKKAHKALNRHNKCFVSSPGFVYRQDGTNELSLLNYLSKIL